MAASSKSSATSSGSQLTVRNIHPSGILVKRLIPFTHLENTVSGDASALTPGGVRLGTSALTSRDMLEADIKVVAGFLHRAVQLALLLQKEAGSKLLKDFVVAASTEREGKEGAKLVKQLRKEVKEFATKWPLPGLDVKDLKKPVGIEEED